MDNKDKKGTAMKSFIRTSLLATTYYFAILLPSACTDGTFYHQYKKVSSDKWQKTDTVTFELPQIWQNEELNAEIGVRTTDNYNYTNLFMLGILERNGEGVSTDTLLINIYNHDGTKNGNGFLFTTTTRQLPSIHVDSGMHYTYKVVHFMKPRQIEGVASIGLKLKHDNIR